MCIFCTYYYKCVFYCLQLINLGPLKVRQNMWNIVEFDDNTVQIVPNCWVSSDQKTCYWPPNGLFKSDKNFLKEVKKCVSPSINWSIYNVSLVLGKYGK